MDSLIECKNLTKKYGKKTVIDNLSMKLECGKIVGLLGPNGSGKTTLMKMIAGVATITEGSITFNFENGPLKDSIVDRKKYISYLPDCVFISGDDTIIKIIDMYDDFYSDFEKDRAMSMLQTLKLNKEEKIRNLSKGTVEKVQLILAMSRNAKIYILDEPLAGADPAARDFVLSLILGNYNTEGTILISTHLISGMENILDEVIFLSDGKIYEKDLADNIRDKYKKSIDQVFREVFKCSEN